MTKIEPLEQFRKSATEDDPEFRAFMKRLDFGSDDSYADEYAWLRQKAREHRRKVTKRQLSRGPILSWNELKKLPSPHWLVPGIVPEGLTRIFGPSNSGKTFLALEWMLTLAVQGYRIVYIAGEGATGIKQRVQAWLKERGYTAADIQDTFYVHHGAVDLLSDITTNGFIKLGQSFDPEVIVIDTLARCFGEGDEDKTKDMNKFVSSCDRLQRRLQLLSVLIVHHTGHGDKTRSRGNSAGLGAVECEIGVRRKDKEVTATCKKMKDAAEFDDRVFTLVDVYGSCVLEPSKATPKKAGTKRLTPNAQKALDLLPPKEGGPINTNDWRQRFYEACPGDTAEAKRQNFSRARKELTDAKVIEINDDDRSVYRA